MPAWRASAALFQRGEPLHPDLDGLAVGLGFDIDQDGGAGFEQRARGGQGLGEHHRLELAGRIREGDEGIGVAALALALARMQHGAGKRAHHAARPRLGGEFDPGLGAERFQHVAVVVERMTGEEEPHRLEFLREPVGRHPGLGLAEILLAPCLVLALARRRRGGPEQVVLPGLLVAVSLLGERDDAIDIGERGRAVDAKLLQGAGGGERFQRALVDGVRIDALGEIARGRGTVPWPRARRRYARRRWRPTFFRAASE